MISESSQSSWIVIQHATLPNSTAIDRVQPSAVPAYQHAHILSLNRDDAQPLRFRHYIRRYMLCTGHRRFLVHYWSHNKKLDDK